MPGPGLLSGAPGDLKLLSVGRLGPGLPPAGRRFSMKVGCLASPGLS